MSWIGVGQEVGWVLGPSVLLQQTAGGAHHHCRRSADSAVITISIDGGVGRAGNRIRSVGSELLVVPHETHSRTLKHAMLKTTAAIAVAQSVMLEQQVAPLGP